MTQQNLKPSMSIRWPIYCMLGLAGLISVLALLGLRPLPIETFKYIHPVGRYVFYAAMAFFILETLLGYTRTTAARVPVAPHSDQSLFIVSTCIALFTFTLCLLALLANWTNGGTQDYSAIGGLVPYSDAAGYYDGAERLLHHRELPAFSERRPLNAAFFAARLLLTDENIYLAILLQVVTLAWALFLATREMYQVKGISIAAIFLAVNFAFASCCLHRTLSEPLGLTLGLLAFTAYSVAIGRRSQVLYAAATAILTLALLTRAGAMFAIPASVLFAALFFSESWKSRCTATGLAIGAIACAWLINAILVHLYGTGGILLSNFSYVLYGLAQGGKGWVQAVQDFPGLRGSEAEIAAFLYRKAFETIVTQPQLLIIGLLRALSQSLLHITLSMFRLFGEAIDGGTPTSRLPSGVAALLLIPALLFGAWKHLTRRPFAIDPLFGFLLLQLPAFVISLPFFYLDGGIRLTAATFPLIAALMGLIVAGCRAAPESQTARPLRRAGYQPVAIVVVIVVVSLAAPQLQRRIEAVPSAQAVACAPNEQKFRVLIGDGTPHINILDGNVKSVLPNISRTDFAVSPYSEIAEFWRTLQLPATILLGFDHNGRTTQLAVAPLGLVDGPRHLSTLCSRPLQSGVLSVRAP